jgi:hypothetical protein
LVNRPITVCAIHSPRVGNKVFISSLVQQNVETIRITHYKDLMAHLPPRTSGLLHIGNSSTVMLPFNDDVNEGYLLDNNNSIIEDTLNSITTTVDYDYHSMVWDINLNNKV